ncbi:helix-turn-helix transcriptional regulator [Candidatus Bathyarchaeota archaeon]|nr:helix-turn-helix transcriptional regulator [Candidatus Bathyarchaeota archaeon]
MKTNMRKYREEVGISQEALAKTVGVSRQTISFLENGRYNPSLRLAWRISTVLRGSLEDIFSFEDEPWRYDEGTENQR